MVYMHIKISGHHVGVSPELELSVHEKLAKVERHFDHINSMQVIFSKENHHTDSSYDGRKGLANHKAEVILRVPGSELFAQATADTLKTTLDLLVAKLDRQIVRHKERLKSHNNQTHHQQFALE
jgi:putative sigma-54 modulation protein